MNRPLPARIDDLPDSLVEMAETLGIGVVLRLVQAFGGQEIKFPRHPRSDHPMIKALGETDGLAVCSYMGGGQMYVPFARRRLSRAEILKLEALGHDRASIARILGISQRHVRRKVHASPRPEPRQPDLFD